MGFIRSMIDLVRGVGNDLSDKMTDPARAARLIQEDLKSVDKKAIDAFTSATENRLVAEKEYNRQKGLLSKFENYAQLAAQQGKTDTARDALQKIREIKPDLERATEDYNQALSYEEDMKKRFQEMEKERQNNFNRAKKMESRAQMNKSQKNVAKLLDKNGMVDGSTSSKLDKLESKVQKEEIRNDAQRTVATGINYREEDKFKELELATTDADLEDELAFLMQNGSLKEKTPISIEEKQSSPLTQPNVEDAEEAVPVHKSEIDKELEQLRKQS